MKLCLVCKEDERFCSCNLSYPKELLDAICEKTGKTFDEVLKIDKKEKLLLYSNATLIKGRVVFNHSGLVAKYNNISYPIDFVDFSLMLNHGVNFEVDGKPFIVTEKVEIKGTQEAVLNEFCDADFEELSIERKILGQSVKQEDVIPFVRELLNAKDFDKNQLISDLCEFIKERQQDFIRQTELDLINNYHKNFHLSFITTVVLLLSYLPEAKNKDKKFIIPILNTTYSKINFGVKTLKELLGILVLGHQKIYPNTELEDFFNDRNVKIGSRVVVDVLAINICNGARTDELYKEIINI